MLLACMLLLAADAFGQESDQVPMPDDMPAEPPPPPAEPVPVPVPAPPQGEIPPEDAPPVDMTPEDERAERKKERERELDEEDREEREYKERRGTNGERVLDDSRKAQEENFGAVLSPLVLPRGGSSVFGWLGVPDIAAGYRHGLGKVELEGRATLNYYWVSLALEGRMRLAVYRKDKWEVGIPLGVGLVLSPGAHWVDDDGVNYVGIRGTLGAMAIYRLSETIHPIFEFEAFNDFALTNAGTHNANIVAGGGVEVYLARGWSALFSARLGWNGVQDQLEPLKSQAAVQIRLGIGYRLF